jgi:hypothetical protein
MAQDYHIEFSVNSTGHMSNTHQRYFSAQTIQRLAKLGLSLDADLYFKG